MGLFGKLFDAPQKIVPERGKIPLVPEFVADAETDAHFIFPITQSSDEEIEGLIKRHALQRKEIGRTLDEYLAPYMNQEVIARFREASNDELGRIAAARALMEYRKRHPK